MKPKLLLLFIFLSFLGGPLHICAQSWKWAVGSICPGSVIESWPITVDSSGNVYEAGIIYPLIGDSTISYFGGDTVRGGGVVIVSTDSNGHYRWALQGICPYLSEVRKIAVGPTGDLYIFGSFSGYIKFGTDSIATAFSSPRAAFCARLDSNGHVRWLKKVTDFCFTAFDATGDVDIYGNAYIAGGFTGASITIGSTTLTNAHAGTSDVFVAKLDTAGNPLWAKRFGGDSIEYVMGVAVTLGGEVLVAGSYRSLSFSIGATTFTDTTTHAPISNFFIVKYDYAGAFVWGSTIVNHSSNSALRGIAVDYWGNIYATGNYSGFITTGSLTLPTASLSNMFLIQYNYFGLPMWYNTMVSSTASYSIAPDRCGNIWVCGATGHNVDDAFIAQYNLSGWFLDSVRVHAGGDDECNVAVDNKGNVYFGADYFGYSVIGTDTLLLIDSTRETLFVAKLGYTFCDINHPLQEAIDKLHPAEITIFPNPATDECTIIAGSPAGALSRAVLYDLTGRQIAAYTLAGDKATIDIRRLSAGMYLCRVYTTDNAVVTKKIVVGR